MKKIAFVYNGILDFGGVEAHLLSIFRHLDKSRYTPVLVSPVSTRYREKVLHLGVQVVPSPMIKPLSFKSIQRLRTVFQQEKIDLVHIHSPIAAISSRIAAKLAGVPAIVTVHLPSTQFYGDIQSLRARAGRWMYISIDRILNYTLTSKLIYVSKTVCKESIRAHLSPRHLSVVISNGIDLSNYAPNRNVKAIRTLYIKDPETIVICYAGRLSGEKGLDILLDSVAELQKSFPQRNVKLWIIGEGPLQDNLRERTQQLNLGSIVQFLGFQSNISDLLHASDIFVLPSLYEGMSIVLLEALASGLPCIVTDVGENAEVIENNVQGLVIPVNQTSALTHALATLLNNPTLRKKMGENALKRSENFSDLKMIELLQGIYQEILGT